MTIATEELPDLESLGQEQQRLRDRLARLRRRLTLQSALESLVEAALILTGVATLLVLLDWQWRIGTSTRLVLLGIIGPLVLLAIGWRIWHRWQASRLDDLALAMTVDRFRPGTGQRVADVLQLPGLLGDPSESASPAMVRLAVRRACEALSDSDWHLLWNRRRTASRLAGLVGCVLVPLAFALVAPSAARLSVDRWLFGSSERWPQQTYLSVVGLGDGNRLIAPRDEPFVIEVRSDLPEMVEVGDRWHVSGRGEPLLLRSVPQSPQSPDRVSIREWTNGRGRRDGVMTAVEPSRFRFEIPASDESSRFDLRGGDDWLGPIAIERVDRPNLASIRLRVREPGTPSNTFRTIENPRQLLTFLPDTEIELTLTGSEPLADLRLDAQPGAVPSPDRIDKRSFATRWTLEEATTLELRLTSEPTGLESRPAFLSIALLRDREPRVTLRALGVGSRVTPVATIPLSLAATDDLGLASVRLQIDRIAPAQAGEQEAPEADRPDRQTVPIAIPSGDDRAVLDHQARHDVDLLAQPPALGTTFVMIAEAEDTSTRGAQRGQSGALRFQVVSHEELFYEILIRQRAERAKFVTALEAVTSQRESLAETPDRDAYLGALRVIVTQTRQLEQIGGRIADTLVEMQLNQIGSVKSHRLLQDGVITPIRSLSAGPMTDLRDVLQTLGGGTPREGADADTARALHETIVAQMNTILEQMSQWESFVDVVNQVAEVIKMQQSILEATEQVRDSRTEEVFDELP
ncbi:hypothetical protein [Tautonia marina]|uniref:hypothetical protein n=1 Tax=Tautonia marina TaxID=2653855 RepID=UPI00191C5757|nr:hypothetical protein [Tautonia marina]